MKTRAAFFLVSIVAALLTVHLHAQTIQGAPGTIDYQGKALDATGNVLAPATPTNYEIRFKIYDAQEGGAVIWSEKQIVTVSKGLFSVRLGEGTALSPAEGTIAQSNLPGAFDSKDRFLGVTIVIPGQTPAEILPRLAFLGTPFAYVANKSISAERLVLASSTAAGSSVNLAQVSYVSQDVTATSATPSDTARSIVINSAEATTITLPGAMATRREYLVIKRDHGPPPDIVKAPAGGTLNGVTDGVIRLKVQGESVLVQSISANDWWVTADTRDKTPVGTIVAFAGDDVPAGYVRCDGTVYSRTDPRMIELFARIATRWGFVDATNFRVPDLRGVFLRGVDSGRGQDPDANSRTAAYPNGSTGGVVGSYQDSDIKTHQHNVTLSGNTTEAGNHNHFTNAGDGERGLIRRSSVNDSGSTTTDGADRGARGTEPDVVNAPSAIPFDGKHSHSVSLSGVTNSAGGNESRPKNVYVHYFIKY